MVALVSNQPPLLLVAPSTSVTKQYISIKCPSFRHLVFMNQGSCERRRYGPAAAVDDATRMRFGPSIETKSNTQSAMLIAVVNPRVEG